MERLRHFALIASAVAALSATACSTADDFAAEVALEAEWQCDVQRQSFGDLSDFGAELDVRLSEAKVTAAAYGAFKDAAESSSTLRARVSDAYDEYCAALPADEVPVE